MVWAAETNIKGPKGDKGDPGASGAATCFMSDTAPIGKPPGSLWWETDTGYLYALYDDGTSVQWVMVSPGSGGISQADADLRYVNVSGDTMTGALTVKTSLNVLDTAGFPVAVVGVDSTHKVQMYYDVAGNAGGISTPTSVPLLINSPNAPLTLAGAPVALHSSYSVPQADKSNAFATTSFVKAWAAPFDALAYNGMQINGSMSVSQERAYVTPVSVTTGANTIYVCDGWTLFYSISAGNVFSQVSQLALSGYGLALVISTTLTPTIAAGDVVGSQQKIEGYRVARLAWGTADAQPVTIGFWSNHARTGQYSMALRNAPGTQYYIAPYTHAVSNVWQWNTITVPGPTVGTWTADNTTSLALTFTAACGATQTAPAANIWAAGSAFYAAPGQINGVAATSDVHRIAGVVILPGSEAPSAARAPLIMRPYDQELLTCKRYWEKSYDYGTTVGTAGVAGAVAFTARAASATATAGSAAGFRFQYPKRAAPTVVVLSTIDGAPGAIDISGGGGLIKVVGAIAGVGQNGVQGVYTVSTGGLTTGQAVETIFHYIADARL